MIILTGTRCKFRSIKVRSNCKRNKWGKNGWDDDSDNNNNNDQNDYNSDEGPDYANSYNDDDNHINGVDLLGPASCPPGSRGGGELMAFLKNRASL